MIHLSLIRGWCSNCNNVDTENPDKKQRAAKNVLCIEGDDTDTNINICIACVAPVLKRIANIKFPAGS